MHRGIHADLTSGYTKGKKMFWWAFSSSTRSLKTVHDFLGEMGHRTKFGIEVRSAVNIQPFSAMPNEAELLILPGTHFEVVSQFSDHQLHEVHLAERPAPAMLDFRHPQLQ